MPAEVITCKDCKKPFQFEESEQRFYAEKKFSKPVRCRLCRKARKDARDSGAGVAAAQQPSHDNRKPKSIEWINGDEERAASRDRRRTYFRRRDHGERD